ncbi:MAG: AraC family transcriptional regulator [Myxococcaceae bacterium]
MSDFRYEERPPPLDLQWAVECFWEAEGPAGGVERIVPDGCPELVVQLGGTMLAADDGAALRAQPRALLVGQRSRALRVSPREPFRTVAVRFRPGALGALLRGQAGALTDGWAPLEDAFGPEARSLVGQLEDVTGALARRSVLERFVRRRLAGVHRTERLEGALATLRAARGRLTIRALREATGASERWLERTFLREVGLPPRTLAAVLRVQAALLLRPSEPSWARLAAALGYFDQPHLNREFRRHAGLPPAALLEALGPLASAFLPMLRSG